jgi:hypothetical protein
VKKRNLPPVCSFPRTDPFIKNPTRTDFLGDSIGWAGKKAHENEKSS